MTDSRMKIWQCLEILRHPDSPGAGSKNNTEQKINALTVIAEEGYPGLIYSLTEFLKDDNKEVRETTCRTITHLFKKINSKKGYYNALRHCSISTGDIHFFETNFPRHQFIELLAISSLNGNGYVREKAVKCLSQIDNPRAIQFLIYRLADWVLQVRQSAINGLENYKTTNYIDSLIEYLPLLEWLQKVERINLNGVYKDILEFITSKNRAYVMNNFKKYPDKLRMRLAWYISNAPENHSREIHLFLTDKHFLIRKLAINYLDKSGHAEIERLLNDKSADIRMQTLYHLKDQSGFETTVKKFLADNSAAIRHFARFTLTQSNIDFAKLYMNNLMTNTRVIGSLSGLAETGNRQHSETIKAFLNRKEVQIRKAAFSALCKLDEECAYDFALANLNSSYPGLRKLSIEFLSHFRGQEVLTTARSIYKTGNYDLRKSMLTLFSNVGGWPAIPDLMLGTMDEHENIRQLSLRHLQTWKVRAINLFATPKKEDLERAKQIFSFVYEIHENKQYFRINPLEGFDFYLR